MDKTVIIRSNQTRNDLLSSFGNDLKETRISAYLGYLLSFRPKELLKLPTNLKFHTSLKDHIAKPTVQDWIPLRALVTKKH